MKCTVTPNLIPGKSFNEFNRGELFALCKFPDCIYLRTCYGAVQLANSESPYSVAEYRDNSDLEKCRAFANCFRFEGKLTLEND